MAIYDVLIIGSGAAGLAAAIYAQRAQLKAAVIEKNMVSGGQILDTYEIENYPGLPGLSGMDLAQKFRDHADQMGAEFIDDEVVDVSFDGEVKKVICSGGTYEAKTVVIATGAHHARLGAAG
jgi:thioredoxin reductase (NADPH)